MKRSARFTAVGSSSGFGGGGVVLTVVGSSSRVVLLAAVGSTSRVVLLAVGSTSRGDVCFSLMLGKKSVTVFVTVMVMSVTVIGRTSLV